MPSSVDLREVATRWLSLWADVGPFAIEASVVRGTTSTTFRVAGETDSYVLKLFHNADLVAAIPDIARREAAGLRCGRDVLGGLVPDVAATAVEAYRDVPPGVLMVELYGASAMRSPRLIEDPIRVLARLHDQAPPGPLPDLYPSWADLDHLDVPQWSTTPAAWRAVLGLIERGSAEEPEVFLHRDFQPANLLWRHQSLTGVVDWTFACRGPASLDLAHYRMNLALLLGLDAAEQAMSRYQELRPMHRHDVWWDATELIAVAANPGGVASGVAGAGVHLDRHLIESVCDEYAVTIAAHS